MIFRLQSVLAAVAVAAAAVSAAAYFAYTAGYSAGVDKVTAKWAQEKANVHAAHSKAIADARNTEMRLSAEAAIRTKEYKNEISRIQRNHSKLSDSLRKRAQRPAPAPAAMPKDPVPESTATAWCTGRELYRDDAEFLARLAARADRLRAALQTCIESHAVAEQ